MLTDKSDYDYFAMDLFRFVAGNGLVAVALPVQVWYVTKAFRMKNIDAAKRPALMRKYVYRSLTLTTLAMAFFYYTSHKHTQMEKELYDKYLGNVSTEGIR